MDWSKPTLKFKISGPIDGAQESMLGKVIEVDDPAMPFQMYQLLQGSTVQIEGGPVILTSDKPPECMSVDFKKDDNTTYNYWSCKTCNINWVCEGCKKGCHSEHETLPHVSNHRPTFACCYCMKKKLCKIRNMTNKNK